MSKCLIENSIYHSTLLYNRFKNLNLCRVFENILKGTVIQIIYKEALRSGKPVFCIVDDTISFKTKPSSQALHPIEDAYFHQSHLKGKQDYGHQAAAVMLSCNGIILNYAIVMYDKSRSKVKIVQDIAEELPAPPIVSYSLCDSWYTCSGIRQKACEFAGCQPRDRWQPELLCPPESACMYRMR